MAAVLSSYSTVGFYRTPVTKCLLCSMFVSSFSLSLPQLAHLRRYFVSNVIDIFENGKVWPFLCCRSTFLDVKDVICGGLLLYYFRVFERRYGSHKFASFLVTTGMTAAILELAVLAALRAFDVHIFRGSFGYLSCGPYELIFPLFVGYFFDVPHVAQTHVVGIPITGKTFTYLLGLQMVVSSPSSMIAALCSLLSGLAYRYNFLRIQGWFRVPDIVASFFAATIGRLVASSPPREALPMGATLEIQRTQQLEILEQQMLFNRARDTRQFGQLYDNMVNHNNFEEYEGGGAAFAQRNIAANYNGDSADEANTANGNQASSGEPPSVAEDQVQTLVEMGFERSKVVTALQSSNNDVSAATSILLRDS